MSKILLRIAFRRLAAWTIDWAVIAIYGLFLFASISPYAKPYFSQSAPEAELAGFLLLTLPLFAYLSVTEGRYGATLGKRAMNLGVRSSTDRPLTPARIMLRNGLKLLPWEAAHFAIWNAFIFQTSPLHLYGYASLMISYSLVFIYFVSLLIMRGRTPYDLASGAIVISTSPK